MKLAERKLIYDGLMKKPNEWHVVYDEPLTIGTKGLASYLAHQISSDGRCRDRIPPDGVKLEAHSSTVEERARVFARWLIGSDVAVPEPCRNCNDEPPAGFACKDCGRG